METRREHTKGESRGIRVSSDASGRRLSGTGTDCRLRSDEVNTAAYGSSSAMAMVDPYTRRLLPSTSGKQTALTEEYCKYHTTRRRAMATEQYKRQKGAFARTYTSRLKERRYNHDLALCLKAPGGERWWLEDIMIHTIL